MASLLREASEDELLARFTCNWTHGIGRMFRDITPAQPSKIRRQCCQSSLGDLDRLPAELLFLTFHHLDFQSLSRLARTSLRGKALVEDLSSYTDMIKHAPTALAALGKARLLSYHPATLLSQTLQSDKCVSCFCFGPLLFLPTCERVCFECLVRKYSFSLTTTHIAKLYFMLTSDELERIPIIHGIPGNYGVGGSSSETQVDRFVSVKQARQLGIQLHGSMENELPVHLGPRMSPEEFCHPELAQNVPLQPLTSDDLSKLREIWSRDKYCLSVMASIRFPYLSDEGVVDYGHFCRGCHALYDAWFERLPLPTSVLLHPIPKFPHSSGAHLAELRRLRSRQEFLEHVQDCRGVLWLIVKF